jgi:hypothetical protein
VACIVGCQHTQILCQRSVHTQQQQQQQQQMQVRKASRTSKSDSTSMSPKSETKESSIEVIVPWCARGQAAGGEKEVGSVPGNDGDDGWAPDPS